ncbi:DUF1097 domain-containing protein [Williamsia soli]|uniref:DUF1097 domain-containing protein n=1 Tax=Williamsia soli TaxID=364929 RepID=UPI001A9D2C29|nr:DUF1097 domain-containing protein [Williamsia soli]
MKTRIDFALALSAGLLVSVWVFLSTKFPAIEIVGWVGLVSTAALFLTGGGIEGAKNSLLTGVVGIGGAALATKLIIEMGGGLAITVVALSVLAFLLVAVSPLPWMSATAVSFLGACCFIAAGVAPDENALFVIWSWLAGLALGLGVGALAARFASVSRRRDGSSVPAVAD